jgi:aryl-alcohol dehydrogenase-like predicted oxidoreductase
MEKLSPVVRLGRTNLVVPQLGFGALPIQRTATGEAVRILRRAFEAGIRFFDTARAYSDGCRSSAPQQIREKTHGRVEDEGTYKARMGCQNS